MMMNQLYCQVKSEEVRREAEKFHMVKIASQERRKLNRQRLAKWAYRIGLHISG
jgi:hypothetical protein